jgi:hypothetical protein
MSASFCCNFKHIHDSEAGPFKTLFNQDPKTASGYALALDLSEITLHVFSGV